MTFRPIESTQGRYEISREGVVRRVADGYVLAQSNGRASGTLANGRPITISIRREIHNAYHEGAERVLMPFGVRRGSARGCAECEGVKP